RGDDIPPALAKRMMEEQITPEVRAGLLRAHFASIGEKGPKADPLSEKLAQEMIRRMQPEEVFALLHLQVHGKPFVLEAPKIDGQDVSPTEPE
ncbi:MAG TPA: hypothetical protein PLO23_11935, partial [Alphaproteobacteria bacterium]|nr:hypothetical protein [Alphaproteobacteria bacterium]